MDERGNNRQSRRDHEEDKQQKTKTKERGMIDEVCGDMRSHSAGKLQPVSSNTLPSQCEVTFTGQHHLTGDPEANKPQSGNTTVAVDFFITEGTGLAAAAASATSNRDRNEE